MPGRKSNQNTPSKESNSMKLTDKELAALEKGAQTTMEKHGFKTLDELIKYYDSLRGY